MNQSYSPVSRAGDPRKWETAPWILAASLFALMINANSQVRAQEEKTKSNAPTSLTIPSLLKVSTFSRGERQDGVTGQLLVSSRRKISFPKLKIVGKRAGIELVSTDLIEFFRPKSDEPSRFGQFLTLSLEPYEEDSLRQYLEKDKHVLYSEDSSTLSHVFLSLLKKDVPIFVRSPRSTPESLTLDEIGTAWVTHDDYWTKPSAKPMLGSYIEAIHSGEKPPISQSDHAHVVPWLVEEVSLRIAEDKTTVSCLRRAPTTERVPYIVLVPTLESGYATTVDKRMRRVSNGTGVEVRTKPAKGTLVQHFDDLEVTVSLPSGAPYPKDTLLKISAGFMITGFQKITPEFSTMLKNDTPIFKMSFPTMKDFDEIRFFPNDEDYLIHDQDQETGIAPRSLAKGEDEMN